MDLRLRLVELARIRGAPAPVVSVYLNTRWTDERQRERVRVFLKNGIRKARRDQRNHEFLSDLDWIQAQGESLIGQEWIADAHGVALFACHAQGLREILPLRVPFEDAFVIADAPFLRPLAALLPQVPAALVVFVDGESARLIPIGPEGVGDEVLLTSEVPGQHRRGGWAQLAQSRYQRHIQDHRGRHFESVAEALAGLAEGNGARRIVMAGEPRTIGAFRKHLPQQIDEWVVGSISGAKYEPAKGMAERAQELLARLEKEEEAAAVDAVLTEAAKGRRAVAGLDESLEAVSRGAVHRLYLIKGFNEAGRVCVECGRLQGGSGANCVVCGKATTATELGEAMVSRVVATGGTAEMIGSHRQLERVGGVAAALRYPL
jgi:peptide subunit release factor 1 (eRF1)